jgi:uncharacterized protein (DUF952 family)
VRLFHIVAPDVWNRAEAAGEYRPPSLAEEGFVHFSFADQVEGVANTRYADLPALQVVEFEIDDDRVVIEDSYGSGTAYPHVYAAVDPAWAVGVHPLHRRGSAWRFSGRTGHAASDP